MGEVPADELLEEEDDVHEDPFEELDARAAGSVENAAGFACGTAGVMGLSRQIADEMRCMSPGALSRILVGGSVTLGSGVLPYLGSGAASALNTLAMNGTHVVVNSAFRTVAQQVVLFRQKRRCGYPAVARPGRSNHENAIAIDVSLGSSNLRALRSAGFRDRLMNDRVHFEFAGGGLVGLDVRAFQRLWNRNHPEDPISGAYGPATEARLLRAPADGFPRGACGGTGQDDVPLPPLRPADPGTTTDSETPLDPALDPSTSSTDPGRSQPSSHDPTGSPPSTDATWGDPVLPPPVSPPPPTLGDEGSQDPSHGAEQPGYGPGADDPPPDPTPDTTGSVPPPDDATGEDEVVAAPECVELDAPDSVAGVACDRAAEAQGSGCSAVPGAAGAGGLWRMLLPLVVAQVARRRRRAGAIRSLAAPRARSLAAHGS